MPQSFPSFRGCLFIFAELPVKQWICILPKWNMVAYALSTLLGHS